MLALSESAPRHDPRDHAAAQHARPRLTIVPFAQWHLEGLRLQASQLGLTTTLTPRHGLALQQAGPAFSALVGRHIYACAGVVEFWEGRGQVWSLLSEDWLLYRKSIHRAVARFLAGYYVRRLECVVDPRSAAAISWAEHLGFHVEHYDGRNPMVMTAYTPQGEDQIMMVRIQR